MYLIRWIWSLYAMILLFSSSVLCCDLIERSADLLEQIEQAQASVDSAEVIYNSLSEHYNNHTRNLSDERLRDFRGLATIVMQKQEDMYAAYGRLNDLECEFVRLYGRFPSQ